MPPIARRALLAGAAALPAIARAQGAPLRMVVPFAPGGATDIAARLVVPALAEALARPVVIENRGGGGTLIGAEAVATAAPDGNTLGFFTITTAALAPAMHRNLRFDIRRSFAPVSLVGTMPMLLVAGPHVPARSLGEFLALLRDSPRTLTYGSAGPGSINHLSAHLLAMRAGGRAEHVPYRGAALVVPDLVAGNVDFLVEGIASLHGHVRAGALRGLAVTGAARSPLLPDVPTAMEGGLADVRILNWFACFAPAGTATAPLTAGLQRAVRSGAVAARLVENGIDPAGSDAATLERFWDAEIALWRPVVQAAGVSLD